MFAIGEACSGCRTLVRHGGDSFQPMSRKPLFYKHFDLGYFSSTFAALLEGRQHTLGKVAAQGRENTQDQVR